LNIARDFLIDIGGGNLATEEIEVELKAKAGNLQQTLEKMQKTLDKLSSGKHEMNLNTNADAIVKSLGNVDKQLKKLSKNNNLNISLSAGDTLARLKNIDDRLKSINRNSKVNLTATTGGTLNRAIDQAEKLNSSLGKIKNKNISVSTSGIDDAIARLTKVSTLLDSIKSKSIKVDVGTAGVQVKSPTGTTLTPKVSGTSSDYNSYQNRAISAAKVFNTAPIGSSDAVKAKKEYEDALNALIKFREAKGSVAYTTIGATYKSIAPKVEKDSAAYKVLQQRINEAKRATSELNGTQINTKSSSSGIMDTAEKLQYFIRLLGRSSKGVGSAGEAMSDALGKIGSGGGVFSKAAFGATAVTAVFAAIAAGAYMVVQSIMQVSSVLQAFGGALMTVLQPGYEVFESTTKNILSLSAALQTMGLIDGQTVQPFQAMSAAVNLTNQAMYRAQASAFSYKEVLEGLAGTLPLVLGKGGTAQQALDISTGVAGVAKLTGLNQNQVLQETRDLLQGTITARTSQVANVLGITNYDIAQYKGNIDGLFTFLQSKFNAYNQAMQAYTNTLPGSIEQLQESIGIAGQTVIDNFAPSITAVAQYVTSLLGTWQDANGTIMDSNGQVTDSIGNVYSSLEEANAAGVQFDETTTSFQSSDTLNEFIQMLSDISDFLVLCADEVYNWAEANGYIDDQTPIFETLGNLIMICLAYVTDTTLAVIDFGAEFARVGRQIFNTVLNPLLTGLEQLYSHIVQIINGFASMVEAGNAALHGDFATASAIKDNAEAYAENERKYRDRIGDEAYTRFTNPNTPIFGDSTGYGGYRTSGKFSQMMEEAKSSGKYTKLSDWAKQAKESGINPGAIRGVEKPDDKVAKKAAKEALQEAKRYYQEQQELLKNELEDIKEQIKKELDHVDALYSQGFLTVEDYYKQKTDLEAQQAKADIDYYNKLIDLTNQTPYKHETDRQKELLKLNRELQKATAKLGDIAETQKYLVDATEQSITMAGQYGTSNAGGKPAGGQVELADSMTPSAIAKAISDGLGGALPPEWVYGQMGFESDGFTNNLVKEGHHNYGGFKTTDSSQKVAFISPEGDNYRHFDTDKEYVEYAIKNFKAYAEDGVLSAKSITEMVQALKHGGYFGSADVSGYIGGTDRYSKEYNASDAATYATNAVNQVGSTIDSALTQGFNAWNGQTMDNARVGCVEAVRKIGSWYSEFLKKETTNSVPTLVADAVNAGIPKIPFDESKLDIGDVVVYDEDEHVLIYRGNGKTVGNSSNALGASGPGMVKEQPLYQGQTPTAILKTGTSGLPTTFTGANSKEQAKIKGDLEKEQDDLLKINQEYFGTMSLGLEQEVEGIRIAYERKIKQASEKIKNTKDERLKKLYTDIANKLGVVKEVKINEVSEKYNKQYIEYKLKELEEKAQQMADHLGLILEDGTDIFNRALASYTDISSAIEKYGQNYFEGAGAKGTDYETKKVADYVKAIMSSGAKDEAIGYLKNFREVKAVVDGYWASFAKSIKMMTDKVSAYFDHQASLIENNKFITAGQKENLKTKVSQQKAQTLVSAGEATIRKYEMEAGKNQTGIFSLETERAPLQKKVDNKTITKEERAVYDAINSRIADYNNRIIDINNNLIPAIRNEIELNKQLAYMPTLLEQVGMTSKQSLEDGLLTFLTDSVNECKTLGEAFSTLIVGMLKDLQKLFAKKMINDLFGQWFGTGDRSQKSTAKESQFMQQQNPYTNYTNYQLAPTNWGLSTKGNTANQYSFTKDNTNDYTFTTPQFRKMDAGIGDQVIVGQDSQDLTVSFGNLKLTADALTATLESLKTSTTTFAGETTNKVTAATGGIISGAGTGISDSIPAMLSNGEAVITAQRVRQLGAGAIHAINRGDFSTIKARIPHFATGGIVGDGAQNTARGMASFAGNIGANVSTTNQISIGLLRDDGAIIEDWMRSSKGQKHLLDFNRNHANVISKFK